MEHVLVVEDDQDIANLIQVNLEELSLNVTHANSAELAFEHLKNTEFALLILDVMLPGMSGLDLCRKIRETHPEQAIMFLTSRDSEIDSVLGLELGADDYMTKPFRVRELQARVRSLLRRANILRQVTEKSLQSFNDKSNVQQILTVGDLRIDQCSHTIHLGEQQLDLTAKEFELLHYLASHPEQVFSREQLLSSVWGYHHSGYEHTVNSHINRLRSKVEKDAANPEIVKTVWGVGYKLSRQGVQNNYIA